MAKKRIPLTGTEVASIGEVISEVAKNSEALQMRLQKVLQTSKGLSGGLAKNFRKVHQQLIADARREENSISRLEKKTRKLTVAEFNQLTALRSSLEKRKKQIQVLDRVNDRQGKLSQLMSTLSAKIKSMASVTGILSKAWDILTSSFGNWLKLSKAFKQAMGQIAQQTGATANQTQQLATGVNRMTGVFANLDGVLGEKHIEQAGQFMGELTTAWREADEVTPSFARSMLEVSRGFGVGVEGATQLRRSLDALGIAKNTEEFRAFSARMLGFSEAIGANSAQMIQDWNDNADAIAQFGSQGEKTFRDAAVMANQFGFETGKIFKMAKGFDTFGEASNRVNQLNAVLGTTISSYELMIEQDPAKRVEMVMQAVQDQGLEWENLNRIQRMTLAEQLNLTEQEASRIFQNGETMQEIEDAREAAAEQERRDALTQRENQEIMNRLLTRTGTLFYNLEEAIQRLANAFSRLLAPIFGDVNDGLTGIVDKATRWINEMGQDTSVQKMIQNVADWIHEAFNRFIEWLPTWDEFKVKAQKAWKVFKEEVPKAIELAQDMWNWIVKQKEEWDSGESSIRKFFDAIEVGVDIVIPILHTLQATFEAIGGAFEAIADPFGTLVEAATSAVDLASAGGILGSNGNIGGHQEGGARGVQQRVTDQLLNSEIRTLAGQGMSYEQIQTTIRRQDSNRRSRGEMTYSQLRAPGQNLNQLIEQRYQAILPSVTPIAVGATEQPATQPTVTASENGGGGNNAPQVVQSQVDVYLDGRKLGQGVGSALVNEAGR